MPLGSSPTSEKRTARESFFDVIAFLCSRFPSLTPIEVLNSETRDVYDLYVDTILKDTRERKEGKAPTTIGAKWVTSSEATWH